ncbi:MAG: sulfite exporter TauE/SafE family protein [Verrucomicrobia bacterium]|nr:sulfite exporter TauE/SafE family protein [Verrucomicrobiota bacterium]
MEFAAINSPGAALVAGAVTSLHCAGMCGPLACALMPVKGDRTDGQTVSTVYHLSRLTGYAVLGALAGGLGRLPLTWVSQSVLRWLPWVFVVFFLALALRWDRFLPKLAALTRVTWKLQGWMRGRSRVEAAAAMGFATPLLPCGPLYFLVALALMSGSALRGVEFMLAFGLGTVPLLWLAQTQFHWVRQKLSPLWLERTRIALALMSAVLIGWRLRATLGFAGPDPSTFICH